MFNMIGKMTTSFFADQEAHAHPGSFDAKVRGESVGLPPDIAKLAEEFGATDTEEFASFCWVFTQDVAARLHWREAEVSRATEQLYLLPGQSVPDDPPRFASGAEVPLEFAGLTAQELAAAKRQTE